MHRLKSDRDDVGEFEVVDLSIFFTSICNSKCLTCDIWKEKDRVEFPLSEVDRLCDSEELRGATFVLLGGEFTVHSKFIEIVELLHAREQPYILVTNALLPHRLQALYTRVPVSNLSVSLDGVGDRHDRVRGVAGNWDKAVELIDWVRAYHPETFLRVGFTVSKFNAREDLAQVAEFCHSRDIDLKVSIASEAAIYAKHGLRMANEELYAFEDLVPQDEYLSMYRPWLRGMDVACEGVQHHPVIMQDGSLILCQQLGLVLGNVIETSFDELWRSPAVRDMIKGYERCRGCWMSCQRKFDAIKRKNPGVSPGVSPASL
jgi:MoaA/NifB/PqqE/SkfB family radical SAM enzyme